VTSPTSSLPNATGWMAGWLSLMLVVAVAGREATRELQVFELMLLQSVLGLVSALSVWQWPSAAVWPWVLLVAFGGTFSHHCMARALRHADATVVVPMDFLRVPLTALGAALILAGNLVNLMRQRAARTSP